MKNFAQLAVSFIVSFVVILVLAAAAGLLRNWAETAASIFSGGGVPGGALAALPAALPAALYIALLLGISYSSRQRIPYPAAFVSLLVISLGLGMAASIGLDFLEERKPFQAAVPPVPVNAGLVLTLAGGEPPTQAVLLQDKADGARILSLPEQALYFEPVSSAYGIRPARLPFREETSPLLQGIAADFDFSARVLKAWFAEGFVPYIVYAGSLSLFLVSLGCLVNISFWPLANLVFGALAFRGALALEVFLDSPEIQQLLASFAGNFIPESLISPLIFTACAVLILLYSALVYLARGRRNG